MQWLNILKENKFSEKENRTSAILEALLIKPQTLLFLKKWINSNQFLTQELLNFLIKEKLIIQENNIFKITKRGQDWINEYKS